MPQKSTSSLRNKILKITLAVLATFIGLYPLFYFFQDNFGLLGNKNSALLANVLWNSAFYTHITAGGLALLLGWVQFNQRIRIATPAMHRNLGNCICYLRFSVQFPGRIWRFMPKAA